MEQPAEQSPEVGDQQDGVVERMFPPSNTVIDLMINSLVNTDICEKYPLKSVMLILSD